MEKQNGKEKLTSQAQFLDKTICKITSPESTIIDDLVAYLKLAFDVELTSPVMWNNSQRQFHVFVAVSKREV